MNFDKLENYLDTLEEDHGINIWGFAVHVNGEEVYRGGNDSPDRNFFHLYSATKPVTAVAAMQLIEQDRMGLYEEVSKYLPAFANLTYLRDGKTASCTQPLRIWHLLTMSGGFDYEDDFEEMHALLDGRDQVPSREPLSLLAKRPLSFEPGTGYQYSLGMDILGSVIEEISGLTLDQYMQENIMEPLGCRDLCFYPTGEQYARMSDQRSAVDPNRVIGKENYFYSARHFPSGGSGLCGSVEAYMTFLDALANDGVGRNGNRILRAETMNLLRTPMLPQTAQRDLQALKTGADYQALGLRTRLLPPGAGMYTGDGAAGAYAVADRDRKLSFFFVAHLLDYPVFYDEIHPEILNLVYEALG